MVERPPDGTSAVLRHRGRSAAGAGLPPAEPPVATALPRTKGRGSEPPRVSQRLFAFVGW